MEMITMKTIRIIIPALIATSLTTSCINDADLTAYMSEGNVRKSLRPIPKKCSLLP